MTNWQFEDRKFKWILAQHNNPDNEEESVANTKAKLIPHLKNSSWWAGLNPLTLKRLKKAKTFHAFNQILAQIYDFADDNKIWLGFMPDKE